MNDFVTSLIRTYVPVVVGAVVAYVTRKLGWVTPDTTAAATAFTGVVIGLYYAAARALEKRYPVLGWLLGRPAQPTYPATPETDEAGAVTIGAILIVAGVIVAFAVAVGAKLFGLAAIVLACAAIVLVGIGVLIGASAQD